MKATFTAEGHPDVTATITTIPGINTAFTFSINKEHMLLAQGVFEQHEALQLAESLQYVADTISAMVPGRLSPFVRGWINLAADVHHTAREKGFWVDGVERNDGEMLALIHAEISEILEGLRKGNPPDDKLPEFSSAETEFADVIIRSMDMAHARGWRVAQAVEAKMKYNTGRPYKHGKEF
jgi:NTP pyrophosphatase (non-canonical NTP hydrolase)